ncbi:MAG: hypothetical protein IJM79_09005 [Erysipelotrichaceae bacterium]|nr:hypothetical protein [Erysipelotrichaceae bacterium]
MKNQNSEIKRQIDFVHSVGQTCNSVGQSELDLQSAVAKYVLQSIEDCCLDNGVSAEGSYRREYDASDSNWCLLRCRQLTTKETRYDIEHVNNDRKLSLPVISAANITDHKPREHCWYGVFVPDRFRRFCLAEGIDCLRFCWVRDFGRYAGEQYFSVLPDQMIPRRLEFKDSWRGPLARALKKDAVRQLGGILNRVAEIFTSLDMETEPCYLEEDMPEEGIGYICSRGLETTRDLRLLIRRDIAERMISEGVLSPSSLKPVAVLKEPYPGSRIIRTVERPFPDEETCLQRLLEYDRMLALNRPQRKATDKIALQLLRRRRENVPEDFGKRMSPRRREEIRKEPYLSLLPYYAFSDGFNIDEAGEFHFLSYQQSLQESEAFHRQMLRQQLLDEDKNATVIALCANGDRVVINESGRVRCFEQETAHFLQEWPDVAEFICAIAESV